MSALEGNMVSSIQQRLRSALPMPLWYGCMVAVWVLLALLPTVWSEADVTMAGVFTGPSASLAQARQWWWVAFINEYIPTLFRACLLLCLIGWVVATLQVRWQRWRLALAFVVVAGVLGPGLVVNWVFKDQWQRARPYQVTQFGGTQQFTRAGVMTDQCNYNCSFVSGHVACGAFLASLALVLRRRKLWIATGVLAGGLVGFSRMAAAGHWLSDVLWAFPITWLTSWLVWCALRRLYASPSRTVG